MDKSEISLEIPESKTKNWKKEIIIAIIAVLLLIGVIILLIILSVSSSNSNFGIINCNYKIEEENVETQIISKSYDDKSINFDIYIEGKKIDFAKTYKFEKAKTYNIQYKLKGDKYGLYV